MDATCPVCGVAIEDFGEGFLAHMRESEPCRETYEHQSASTAAEWAKR